MKHQACSRVHKLLIAACVGGLLLPAASAQTSSVLTSPANGSTVSPQHIQFAWTAVSDVINYTLWIGSMPGAKDALYYSTSTTSNPAGITSTTATLKPAVTYYATLFTKTSAGYATTTSTFRTAANAVILFPADGAKNLDAGAPIAVNWTPVPGATQYELYLGSSVGANNYYDSGGVTSVTVSVNLKPNTTYYARLFTTIAGTATSIDSTFNTGYSLAHLTYPLDGATDVSPFQPFTWEQPDGATGYILTVSPTGYGTPDFYLSAGSQLVPTVTSQYVYALQPETTYYVDLCTSNPNPGGATCVHSRFTTAAATALPPDRNLFYQKVMMLTAQVRLMTEGTSLIPTPGTPLSNQLLSYGANPARGAKCGNFATTLLNLFTQKEILARQRGLSSDGMDTHVLTEYWDPFNQQWQVAGPVLRYRLLQSPDANRSKRRRDQQLPEQRRARFHRAPVCYFQRNAVCDVLLYGPDALLRECSAIRHDFPAGGVELRSQFPSAIYESGFFQCDRYGGSLYLPFCETDRQHRGAIRNPRRLRSLPATRRDMQRASI